MARPSKYSPEVRERFVRPVQEHTAEHGSQWARLPRLLRRQAARPKRYGGGCARPNATPVRGPA
jgi:hypothetical protein